MRGFLIGVMIGAAAGAALAAPVDPLVFVDPLIGTGRDGAVAPGAAARFGMVQWSPETPSSPIFNYDFADHEILGMSRTHMSGTGCLNGAELSDRPDGRRRQRR